MSCVWLSRFQDGEGIFLGGALVGTFLVLLESLLSHFRHFLGSGFGFPVSISTRRGVATQKNRTKTHTHAWPFLVVNKGLGTFLGPSTK